MDERRKMGKVKKSKRWGSEWTRAGKRRKGCPAPCGTPEPSSYLQLAPRYFQKKTGEATD